MRAALTGLLLLGCAEVAPDGVSPTGGAAPASGLPVFFDCLDREGVALVSAHRGTDGVMPENALGSIEAVTARTGGLVEVDVATSADGVLFLHHDDTLDRTTTGSGPADASWETLRQVSLRDAGGRATAARVTTLKELLQWAEGRAVVQLDIKPSTDYDDVAALLRETGAGSRVVLIAYSLGQARVIARKFPDSMISATVRSMDDLRALTEAGVPSARILAWTGNDAADPKLYTALDEAGVEVIFGTLGGRDERIAASGDEGAYAELVREGVDVIATDRPVEAVDVLREAGIRTDASVCFGGAG